MLTRLEIEQRTISRSWRKSTSLITLYYVLTVMTCNYSHLDKVSYRETGEVSCGHLFRYNFQSYNTNTLSKAEGDEKKENINKGLSWEWEMYGDIDENWLLDLGIERINWQVWQVWQVSAVRGNVKSRSLNITITNYSDRNGRNIQLFSESVWSVWLIPQRFVSFVLRNKIICDDKKKALLKFDNNHMCRLWNCKGFSSFIDYLWELSVAVKNSYRCNFGQLVRSSGKLWLIRQAVS